MPNNSPANCTGVGNPQFVGTYHSAISLEARGQAEDAMNGSVYRSVCLACTSAMELGIDIGDLDRVVQWGPPGSVSSLLQRWGRTGRRAGRVQDTSIYTQSAAETLTALAETRWHRKGGPSRSIRRPGHTTSCSADAQPCPPERWHQRGRPLDTVAGHQRFSRIGQQDYEELTADSGRPPACSLASRESWCWVTWPKSAWVPGGFRP